SYKSPLRRLPRLNYSWSSFGREAEYIVALYLKSAGWSDVRLSPGSRGPADIVASRHGAITWYIQVKASSGIPRLKAYEIRRLVALAGKNDGKPVVSTLQPFPASAFSTGNFSVNFYEIDSWKVLDPTCFPDSKGSASLRSKARSP
ncbi:MAG TPA: restriction endonuclease, partial [Nitrososphaera sp.]|nr:restriction endonuclease [Nitrososphaera sp.]